MLNDVHRTPDTPAHRGAFLSIVLVFAAAFLAFQSTYLAPTHSGVDQNGYLVGGRLLAEHGSMAFRPVSPATGKVDPFMFVGRMWIGVDLNTAHERYYPKYPIGLPVLVALAWKLGGAAVAYWISPIAMTLALVATALLARAIAGSFLGLVAMLAVGTSPITLTLATNPNSHAATLAFACWGLYLLACWSRRGGPALAVAAGLLTGYATTIRYTEGLLLLPVLLVAWWRDRATPRDRQAWLAPAAWAIPVLALLAHNRAAFGTWTGYDTCNESTGFALAYFRDNWDTMLHQVGGVGLFFFFPLGVAGLLFMAWRVRRLALFMAAWILPNLAVYSFYYWAPDNLGYLRFFLTILPGIAICGVWLLAEMAAGLHRREPVPGGPLRHPALLASAGLLALVSATVNLSDTVDQMTSEWIGRRALYERQRDLQEVAPAGAVVFCQDANTLNALQFTSDYVLYDTSLFDRRTLDRKAPPSDPNAPQPLQPDRQKSLQARLKGLTLAQLVEEQRGRMTNALANDRRVFVIKRADPPRAVTTTTKSSTPRRLTGTEQALAGVVVPRGPYKAELVESWAEPGPMPPRAAPKLRGRRPDPRASKPPYRSPMMWWLIEVRRDPPTG